MPEALFTKYQTALATPGEGDATVQTVKKQLRYIEADGPVSSSCWSFLTRSELMPTSCSPANSADLGNVSWL
jgi:hypothetical protein